MNTGTMIKAGIATVVIALTGCATQRDLEATREVADRALQAATAAQAAGDAAMEAANRAKNEASAAQSTANQAQQAAQASQACCDANKETLKRMVEQFLSK